MSALEDSQTEAADLLAAPKLPVRCAPNLGRRDRLRNFLKADLRAITLEVVVAAEAAVRESACVSFDQLFFAVTYFHVAPPCVLCGEQRTYRIRGALFEPRRVGRLGDFQ